MNIKPFFSEALGQALDLGIGTPEDVLRHVTPDLLAAHLPRPLWARLLTACLGAPKVDAQLVVETIGVPNLCEHLPSNVIWAVVSDIAARVLGGSIASDVTASAAPQPIVQMKSAPQSVLGPPPDAIATRFGSAPAAVGPSIPAPATHPLADLITELEQDDRSTTPSRSRTPTAQRFRQSNTGLGRLGASAQPQQRRPQAQAAVPTPAPVVSRGPVRRSPTEVEESETEVSGGEREIPVDDSQLVDWSTETTHTTTDEDFSDIGRKR